MRETDWELGEARSEDYGGHRGGGKTLVQPSTCQVPGFRAGVVSQLANTLDVTGKIFSHMIRTILQPEQEG